MPEETSRHTEGPWTAHLDQHREMWEIRSGSNSEIAALDMLLDCGHEESAANATLIAAAPDLLAALETLATAVNVKELDPITVFASVERARAAIAKARGEAQS